MKLIFIGTGNCILDPDRGMPCIAVKTSEGVSLLDAGSGSIHSCIQYGISLPDIKSAIITHFHVDHVLDIVQLLWLRHIHEAVITHPLRLVGPPGTADFISSLGRTFGRSVSLDSSMLEFKEIPPGEKAEASGMTVSAFKSNHTDESICCRLVMGGKHVAYSGDSGPCDGLIKACDKTDIAVLECSYDGPSPITTHMGPPECACVGAQSAAKHIILTHLPSGIERAAILAAVKKDYNGPCSIAQDFMEINL